MSATEIAGQTGGDNSDVRPFQVDFPEAELTELRRRLSAARAERAYPHNLIHYNRLDRGGHFAAWEQPQLFSEEMRAAFRSLR
jgi:pimeloyl-ACP methyl ester carboxylesterase